MMFSTFRSPAILRFSLCKSPPLVFRHYYASSSSSSSSSSSTFSCISFSTLVCVLKSNNRNLSMNRKKHFSSSSSLATEVDTKHENSAIPSKKSKKRAQRQSPESLLKLNLDMCSKRGDLIEALRLYDDAKISGTQLNLHHYNVLLYLCSSSTKSESSTRDVELGLRRGFEIFDQMSIDRILPNEATFTSVARLAVLREDPEMAFDLVKKMLESKILPKLRSYEPALFGFCKKGEEEKAYEVDAHMIESGVSAEEPELAALLKISSEKSREEKVYQFLHRLRANVRRISEPTAQIVENWFNSDTAADVGKENWDVEKIKEGIVKGGGGWHGHGWLGKGKWKVERTEMNDRGFCGCCGEKLVCIDIDPSETENFATSLLNLACQKEVKSDFVRFQEWLDDHGPFDAVIDGANVSLFNQHNFSFFQLNSVIKGMQEVSPSKKMPLVILHNRRVKHGPADNPKNKKLLETWKKSGALYCTPVGSNDDWYWLYAAVRCKCLLVTNDEMRDHLFQLLGNSFFPRWKEKHQVRLTFSRRGPSFHMPPPYSIVIQESEKGSWHVPLETDDDIEIPRKWVCATRVSAMKV